MSTCLPYIHLVWPEVLGECYWNISPTLYYFTGFVGYLLLGSYAKKYGPASIPAAVTMLFLGYLVSVLVFCSRIATVDTAEAVELSWQFCVINVVMMVWGLFSLLVRINHVPAVLAKVIVDISICSYAMYLGHIMLLNFYHQIFGGWTWNVLFEIPVIAICTFITVLLLDYSENYLKRNIGLVLTINFRCCSVSIRYLPPFTLTDNPYMLPDI